MAALAINADAVLPLKASCWVLTMPGAAAAALQTLLGLNHMHKRKVLHRDVKTLNIFLDESLNVKIGDMGVSGRGLNQHGRSRACVGMP